MTDTPSISVIVPVYKVEQYIKICIDSILAQTFQDFEIILVDDASPDACVEICEKLYGGNEKIRLVRHEKNLGLGATRNTGMKHARGKYICFVDSDDSILPNTLEKFFTVAEKTNAQVVHAAGRYELWQDAPEPILKENLKLEWDPYNTEGFLPNNIIYRLEEHWRKYGTWPMAWLCFCRRDFLLENQIEFLPIISEDEPFSFTLLFLAERYYILHDAFYIYRRRRGSIMMTEDVKTFSQRIESMIISSAYVKKFLDRLPNFDGREVLCEKLLNASVIRVAANRTTLHYENLNISDEINAAAFNTLKKFFGDGATFAKFFFNGFHIQQRQTELLGQQNQRLNNLLSISVSEQHALSEIINALKANGKRILLLGTPNHGNLGDQAIVLGELHILKKFFPEHNVVEISYDYLTGTRGELLFALGFEKYIQSNDVIFWHGGGNFGNLWINEEYLRRALTKKFPQNKIVIFPQSICFTDDDAGRRELINSQEIYTAHKDLHLITRDEISFKFAKKFFSAIKSYLLPDSVTVLQGIVDDVDIKRKGVLFVLRRDKEKIRNDAVIKRIQDYLTTKNIPFEVTDTVIDEKIIAQNREQKVRDILLKIRGSKLVVTDRFHGVIFSFITRTPVLAFKSFDTKISSGIKWFKNFPSIFYAESQSQTNIKKFIDKNYFAVDKEESAVLNQIIDTDAEEKFFGVLNEITGTTKGKILPNKNLSNSINPPPPRIKFRRVFSSMFGKSALSKKYGIFDERSHSRERRAKHYDCLESRRRQILLRAHG